MRLLPVPSFVSSSPPLTLSLSSPPLPQFFSVSPFSRKPSRPRPWPLMFFIKLTLAARESTALLSTPRHRVCIISFIIQLALNSTLFRGRDRSLRPRRPSSSFSSRTLLLLLFTWEGILLHLSHARWALDAAAFATHSHCSLILSAVSVSISTSSLPCNLGFLNELRFRLHVTRYLRSDNSSSVVFVFLQKIF